MQQLEIPYRRKSERGELIEVSRDDWKQVNHLAIKEGYIFGGHYHKRKKELFYLLSGKVTIEIINNKGGYSVEMNPGDLLLVEPLDLHTIKAVEDSQLIEMLSHHYSEEDTYA